MLLFALGVYGRGVYAYNPTAGDYSKQQTTDVRILSYNTARYFIAESTRDAAFNRIFKAINPDIAILAEMPVDVTVDDVVTRLNTILPLVSGSWQANDGLDDGYSRVVIASKYSLSLKRNNTIPVASTRGINLCLVDLPNAQYSVDLYLLGVHLKAGSTTSDDVKRQRSADAIVSWMGDARSSGGNITLATNTPMIVAGDFNLVGEPEPETTLLTGDIQDNATFGADVKSDWDGSNPTDLQPADPFTGDTDTWSSNYTTPASRLDRFIYTDSVANAGARFVLNTLTMTTAARTAAGLQTNDTKSTSTSDHLPIVMDVRPNAFVDCNGNSVNDPVDIANGTSADCDGNNVPDECQADSDADGVIDACDNCPAEPNALQADSDGDQIGDACDCASPFADVDGDGDVDQNDFGVVQVCLSGDSSAAIESCRCLDRNADADVDATDLQSFLDCMSGPGIAADTNCGQ
jgi:endonuclease/exonuclease/phosphatase family metal-dependent hydrolase